MNKELQDLAWVILPKEFKEEVKKEYSRFLFTREGYYDELFGKHNLTSDTEGEEILCVPRKKIQELYASHAREHRNDTSAPKNNVSVNRISLASKNAMLAELFGSKCLPDGTKDATKEPKPAEPKFEVGDIVRIKSNAAEYHQGYQNGYCWLPERDVYVGKLTTITNIRVYGDIELKISGEGITWEAIDLEPYTEPKKESRNLSQETTNCDKQFDNILKDSFRNERRLNIATQILSGIVASSKPCKHPVKRAIELADSLMSECEKGDFK